MLIKCFWERVPPTLWAAHTPKTAWLGRRSRLYGPVDRYAARESIFNLQLVAGDHMVNRRRFQTLPGSEKIPDQFCTSALKKQPSVGFHLQLPVNSRLSLIIPATYFTLDSLCPRCRKCKSEAWQTMSGRLWHVGAPGVAVVPRLNSSSSKVIILVAVLRLIICDFGMPCFCLPLVTPHLVQIEYADRGEYLPAWRYLNEGAM